MSPEQDSMFKSDCSQGGPAACPQACKLGAMHTLAKALSPAERKSCFQAEAHHFYNPRKPLLCERTAVLMDSKV